tara:strand:+ start:1825 stop:2340 length:516 start_codon:yes stop_codon:yes gene_type:complete
MDGTYAVLFLLAGLTDMKLNHCETGCLARSDTQAYGTLAYGDVLFQEDTIGREGYLRYDFGRMYGPFQPALGVSLTDQGDAWIGFGATWTGRFANDRGYIQMSFLPGIHTTGDGPDIGTPLEFRSGAELGYEASNGWRIGLSYDHRSNAGLASNNPGLETLQIRVHVPVGR